MTLLQSLVDARFTGADLLLVAFVAGMACFARFASLRALRQVPSDQALIDRARGARRRLEHRDPAVFTPDPALNVARAVRRSFDGLPYRGAPACRRRRLHGA